MGNILQLRIDLKNIKPPIWRRIQMPDDHFMDEFHEVIQVVMGWTNSHLHEFQFQERRIGPQMDDFFEMEDEDLEDESEIELSDLNLQKGDKLLYIYDFGDNWEHEISVEKVTEGELDLPVCLKGKRACPPEDVGGPWGYESFLEVIKNPDHPDHRDMVEWAGVFAPEKFDVEEVNETLRSYEEY